MEKTDYLEKIELQECEIARLRKALQDADEAILKVNQDALGRLEGEVLWAMLPNRAMAAPLKAIRNQTIRLAAIKYATQHGLHPATAMKNAIELWNTIEKGLEKLDADES